MNDTPTLSIYKAEFQINRCNMILILFFASISGELRGPRPNVEETSPIYEDLDIGNLILNISATIVEIDYDINIINDIILSNCENSEEIFGVLPTIVSPVVEILEVSDLSHNCTKIFQQYKIVFLFLIIFTATLNLSGMISVILSWRKSARYKFPEDAFQKSSSYPEKSVSLVSNKETYV